MTLSHTRRLALSATAIAGSILWGLFEVVALARSRWATRHQRPLAARGPRT